MIKKTIAHILLIILLMGVSPICNSSEIADDKKIKSIINEMSIDEKVGQLFMVGIYTEITGRFERDTKKLVRELKPGGVF